MQEVNPIINSIRDYILLCPLLSDERKVNVDYLGTEMSYSINPQPSTPILKQYVDGGSMRQLQFDFTSNETYDEDARTGIENSGFYEEFESWLEEQNKQKVFPVLSGNKTAIKVETLTSGYLFDNDENSARYQIQCRLIYEQKG